MCGIVYSLMQIHFLRFASQSFFYILKIIERTTAPPVSSFPGFPVGPAALDQQTKKDCFGLQLRMYSW